MLSKTTLWDGPLEEWRGAEENFFDAVSEGDQALTEFADKLFRLHCTIESANFRESLGERAARLLYRVASTVSVIAQGFLVLRNEAEDGSRILNEDLDGIFSKMSLCDAGVCDESTNEPSTPRLSIDKDVEATSPEVCHVTGAFEWLLEHRYSPYPPKSVRLCLGQKNRMQPKAISNWFSNIRKRTGWNALVKRHFGGNRTLCVDCAHRIFMRDTSRVVSGDTIRQFEAVWDKMQRLHDERLVESDLAKTAIGRATSLPNDLNDAQTSLRTTPKKRFKMNTSQRTSSYLAPSAGNSEGLDDRLLNFITSPGSSSAGDGYHHVSSVYIPGSKRPLWDSFLDDDDGTHDSSVPERLIKRRRNSNSTSTSQSSCFAETPGTHIPINSPYACQNLDTWFAGLSQDVFSSDEGNDAQKSFEYEINSRKRHSSELNAYSANAASFSRPTKRLRRVIETEDVPRQTTRTNKQIICVDDNLYQALCQADLLLIPPPASTDPCESLKGIVLDASTSELSSSASCDSKVLTLLESFSCPTFEQLFPDHSFFPAEGTQQACDSGLYKLTTTNAFEELHHTFFADVNVMQQLNTSSDVTSTFACHEQSGELNVPLPTGPTSRSTRNSENCDRETKERRLRKLLAEVDILKSELVVTR